MKSSVIAAITGATLAFAPFAVQADEDLTEANKALVLTAATELLVNGDPSNVDAYFHEDYLQHNPNFPSGSAVIKELFSNMPEGFSYEIGTVVAEDDMVVLHSRVTGFGPNPMIVFDMFRVEDGKIAEHWDILQEEVTETASGLPMWENRMDN